MQTAETMEKQAARSKPFLIHVLLPMASSILIYLLWRGFPLLDPARNIFPLLSPVKVPGFIKYNLTDGLYFYSLVSALMLIWKDQIFKQGLFWLALSVMLSFVWEIIQIWHIIPGTFDVLDLVAYAAAGIICLLQFQKQSIKNKYTTIKS
jgi:hypothetical protein